MRPRTRSAALLLGLSMLACADFRGGLGLCQDAGRCEERPSDTLSTVEATPRTQFADGQSPVLVTVTVLDAEGRPVQGQVIELRFSGEATVTPRATKSTAQGVATFSLVAHAPSTGTLSAIVNGTLALAATPTLDFVREWVAVAAGWDHTLALKDDGTLWAWGTNNQSQLGDGTTSGAPTPRPVETSARALAAGYGHSAAVDETGLLLSWGMGSWLNNPSSRPKAFEKLVGERFDSVVAGFDHFVAINRDGGTLWAWGNSTQGRLGDESAVSSDHPAPLPIEARDFVSVAAGRAHNLALQRDGGLWVWGGNGRGQLGVGDVRDDATPRQLAMPPIIKVAAGEYHSLAIEASGDLWAWGSNDFAQLGNDSHEPSRVPVKIGADFRAVAAGYHHSLAIGTDGGALFVWGCGPETGAGQRCGTPTQLGSGFEAVAGGGFHSAALKDDGSLWLWGSNAGGQLGFADGPLVQATPRRLH